MERLQHKAFDDGQSFTFLNKDGTHQITFTSKEDKDAYLDGVCGGKTPIVFDFTIPVDITIYQSKQHFIDTMVKQYLYTMDGGCPQASMHENWLIKYFDREDWERIFNLMKKNGEKLYSEYTYKLTKPVILKAFRKQIRKFDTPKSNGFS